MKKLTMSLMFALSMSFIACAHGPHGKGSCCKDGECKMEKEKSKDCCKDGECKMEKSEEKK